ncbi:DUF2786 domain-containing protein [Lysinibacillus fusiformis]|uniref:DUF2786 domain-containing protein n=2 Tax=Lysinibacillus fusiformis TaxID=28031 RepID=A0A1H9SV33_9BACI|nr:DUF2786 domain-containing protein [Lysinibacillus fusiformis]SCY85971.1 Protein of unknown function [Lysinibacillus fusiformis]SEO60966.1 Protein of unknown function [Lysinibacillus fusiformis]SER88748.1 Protein of unknown function [Lysinibacillus fusiformis]
MKLSESIKTKIQKLLTLAKDATDEESQTAMLHARRLMLKHNIQESELVSSHVNDKTVVNERVYRNKLIWWHRRLAQIIGRHFRCSYYRNTIDSYQAEIRFVGLEEDVQIAVMIYNFARASIHYHSKAFLLRPEIKRKWKRKHQFKNDYIEGYLAGLNRKFLEQNKSESLELIVVQDPLVIQYYNSLSLTSLDIPSPKKAGDDVAWRNGYNDGKKFESGREMIE